jgi:hypothetical protein
MSVRTALLMLLLLAGCATGAPPPGPGLAAGPDPAPTPAASAGPSDWALAIVGTPFVFAFRTVVCAATAVVAGPTAGVLALSAEREAGLDYLRWGLAENCDGPYVVPVPVAGRYDPDPDVARPRPLVSDDEPGILQPRRLAAVAPVTAEN